MLATIHGWLDESLAGVAFVAVEADGIVGFVTVAERKHFTGVAEAYVGELAVVEDAEGRGVGRALMEAVEAGHATEISRVFRWTPAPQTQAPAASTPLSAMKRRKSGSRRRSPEARAVTSSKERIGRPAQGSFRTTGPDQRPTLRGRDPPQTEEAA